MNLKKILIVIVAALALIGIYLFLSTYMSASVYRAHEGVVVQDNEVVADKVMIVVAGERKYSLFKPDVIYGTVTVDDGTTYHMILTDDGTSYLGKVYDGFGASNLVEVGEMRSTSGLKELYLSLKDIDEEYGSGSILYAPATNFEDAQAIKDSLIIK